MQQYIFGTVLANFAELYSSFFYENKWRRIASKLHFNKKDPFY